VSENIIKLVHDKKDPKRPTPLDVIDACKNQLSEGGRLENYNNCMVIALNNTDGQYKLAYARSAMKSSECIALLVMTIAELRHKMGE
jgi:hypothetical protein